MGSNEIFAVSLRLRDQVRDAGAMLAAWGLNVDRSWRAGEPRTTVKGRALPGTHSESYATSRFQLNEDRSLTGCIDQVMGQIEGFSSQLAEFVDGGGWAELFVGWHVAGNSGATLEPELMRRLADKRLALALDVYPEGATDEGQVDA